MTGGFSMIEALVVTAYAGSALGGLQGLTAAVVREGGQGERRLQARLAVIGALDRGGPACRAEGSWREARASWDGGALRLRVWAGP